MSTENSKSKTLLSGLCMWAQESCFMSPPSYQEENLDDLERAYLTSGFADDLENRTETILFVEKQRELLQLLMQFSKEDFHFINHQVLKPLHNVP